MNDMDFNHLMTQAVVASRTGINDNQDVAVQTVLAAVDNEPGLVARVRESDGRTFLHQSCQGSISLTRGLLDRHADLHKRDRSGKDALMIAAIYERPLLIDLLISRGANINARDSYGWTALANAVSQDSLECGLRLISEHGADLDAKDNLGKDCIHLHIEYHGEGAVAKDNRKKLFDAYMNKLKRDRASQAQEISSQAARIAVLQRPARATASMLFSDKFADVVFVCSGGERIPAHRNILAACSESLDALLSNPHWVETADARERVAEIVLEQSETAVRVMLRFVYTGEVDEAGLSSNQMGVLDLSSRHLLPELKAECERCLVRSLTVATLPDFLIAAYLHNLAALKASCIDFIRANMPAVTLSTSFASLHVSHPAIWKEVRAAMQLPEEAEEEGREGQGPAQRARREE